LELAGLDVSAVRRPDGVVLRDSQRVAGLGAEEIDWLYPRAEDLHHGNKVSVLPYYMNDLLTYEILDRHQPLAGRDERVAGDTGIAGVDPSRVRAGVPVVDRRVELHAGIAAGPSGLRDRLHQIARFVLLERVAAEDALRPPVGVGLDRLHELVLDAH